MNETNRSGAGRIAANKKMKALGVAAVAAALGAAACSGGAGDAAGEEADRAEFAASHCADIYAPDLLPTFQVDVAGADWQAMQDEYATWMQRQAAGLEPPRRR